MSWREHLFGDASYLGAISIKTGLTPKRWRPGRRSVELKRLKAIRQAQNTQIIDVLAARRAAIKKAQGTAINAPKPAPAKPGAPVGITRPTPVPVRRPPGVVLHASPPPPSRGMMGFLAGALAGVLDHFGDGMGATTPPKPAGHNDVGVVIDPVTGEPLPPGWTLDPSGNPVPPGDPAPPTGPGGVPYTGNAQVWVSQGPVQMFWDPRGAVDPQDTGAVKAFQDPCLYPDGAPIIGQVWLPKLNLTTMNDAFRSTIVRAAVVTDDTPAITWPRNDGVDYFHVGRGEPYPNQVGRPGYRYKGTHAIDGDTYRKWLAGQARAPWGPVEPWGPLAQTEAHKAGGNNLVYYTGASFDWSGSDPTTAAYPWLYDWFSDDFMQWKVMPADLWLSTGVPISSLTQGVYLPYSPAPLLQNLDFLDSLATGNHGMPQVLHWDTGVLDFDALAAWCNQDPKWARLGVVISQAKQQPFMVATIYDVVETQVSPGTNATNPVPPLPPPPIDPAPPLVDPNDPYYGGGYYPPDPYGGGYPGGGYVDYGSDAGGYDPNAPSFVPNDYGGGYAPDYAGGYAPDYAGGYAPDYPPQQAPLASLPVPQDLPPVVPPYVDDYGYDDGGDYYDDVPLTAADFALDDYGAQDFGDDEDAGY